MPQARTRAFVLGQWRSGEQDKRVHLLSREHGRMRALAPGACRMKNRFGATLELFTEADFLYYFKEDRGQVTLSRADPIKSRFDLISRPEWIFYFSLMSEALVRFLPLCQTEERAYRMVGAVLDAAEKGARPAVLTIYFLAWLLRIQGTMFRPDQCFRCRREALTEAWVRDNFRGLACRECRTGEAMHLNGEILGSLAWIGKNPPDAPPPLSNENAAVLLRVLARKLEYDGEFTLTSPRCLPEFR